MVINYQYLTPETTQENDVDDINRLLGQLTQRPCHIDKAKLEEVSKNSLILIARDSVKGQILGMNTLCILYLPTGRVGFLEDVVVDSSLRGAGIGKELVKRLVERAKSERIVDRIELTCNPSRIVANILYPKLGFEPRETNNYILKL